MKKLILIVALIACTASALYSAENKRNRPGAPDMETLEGITHYGMAIQEIVKVYKNNGSVLEVVYSKKQSDDNMDDYVKRFYDELLRQIEKWLYENKLPGKDMCLVISNCKFCKIGYCKKKNNKELSLVLYSSGKEIRKLAFKHMDIIDKTKYIDMARSAVIIFLDKQ